jgi:hypothetical protein
MEIMSDLSGNRGHRKNRAKNAEKEVDTLFIFIEGFVILPNSLKSLYISRNQLR